MSIPGLTYASASYLSLLSFSYPNPLSSVCKHKTFVTCFSACFARVSFSRSVHGDIGSVQCHVCLFCCQHTLHPASSSPWAPLSTFSPIYCHRGHTRSPPSLPPLSLMNRTSLIDKDGAGTQTPITATCKSCSH